MESPYFLPLLATLQIFFLCGSPADLPAPPNIFVSPEKMEYLIGDAVSFRCEAPSSKAKVQGFQFSGTAGWAVDIRTFRKAYTYSFNITGPKDGGSHTCRYTVTDRLLRPVRSKESKAIIINVKDPPLPPMLSLNTSSGVVSEGYPLLFICMAPGNTVERRFHFYKEGAEVIPGAEVNSSETSAQLCIPQSSQNHTGNFTCAYEEEVEGRWILSFVSSIVTVFVKEPPFAPELGVDPSSAVVTEGYPLRLTCIAFRDDSRLRFHFYRDGVEIPPGQAGSETTAMNPGNFTELLFPQTPRRFSGKFTCGFEEDVDGTWVPSPQSKVLEVTVKDPPAQPDLILNPASGEVREGDPLLITCVAYGTSGEWKFYFYKDGTEQFSEACTRNRSFFSIPAAKPTVTGQFTCRYEERVSGKWIPSPLSQAMMVTMHASSLPIPLVTGCAAAAAALVVVLLLAAFICQRRRGHVHWKGLHNKDDTSAYPLALVS
ncbi:Fc receptor-like protein 5 [Struthio camelus]|uniref:Fc receptor-like protein 5 n=1 Tax=Struthio camelus TaxID=8801 RepID=UPI0036041125